MNLTQPQESTRIHKNLYQTITPKKARTFSESMTRRRLPFLSLENDLSPAPFLTPAKKTSTHSKELFKYDGNELKQSLKTPDIIRHNNSIFNSDTEKDSKENSLQRSPLVCYKYVQEAEISTKISSPCHSDVLTLKYDVDKINKSEKWDNETKEDQLRLSNMETQVSVETSNLNKAQIEFTTEIEKNNCSEVSQISGYYSEGSLNETNSFLESEKSIDEQRKPLKNSTFLYLKEISNSALSCDLNENIIGAETFFLNDTNTDKATINAETSNIPIRNKEGSMNKDLIFIKRGQSQNSKVPLIFINEINIIDNNLSTKKGDITKLKALKKVEENEKLQEKKTNTELSKQKENKEKVMSQLLEMADSTGFPKLKHICNNECEIDKDAACKKIKEKTDINAKQQQEPTGFFQYIWSVIKYPFVSSSSTNEKKEENVESIKEDLKTSQEGNKDEGELKNVTVEKGEKQSTESSNDIKGGKEDQVKIDEIKQLTVSTKNDQVSESLQNESEGDNNLDKRDKCEGNLTIEQDIRNKIEDSTKDKILNVIYTLAKEINETNSRVALENKLEIGKEQEKQMDENSNNSHVVFAFHNEI